MGLLLALSDIYVPRFIRKRQLTSLFQATADAFQVTAPSGKGLSFDEYLTLYAQFTREQAEKSIQQDNIREVQPHLFQNAQRLGQQYREEFNLNDIVDIMHMSTVIYKVLKIEFQGNSQGAIIINHCFFSKYYSKDVCQLISALDKGLLAGLSGGGQLNFSQRITEGNKCCRAYLDLSGKLK